ncbi:MAG TPA: hypothetical protein VEC35_14560 [Noviherbaspirillum sp.]|nr:hypothetical protein [Noviherbaspirillum sp.]
MTGYRKAAVALHALNEDDRHWVLAELPDADRSTLVGYLDELKALGFTAGAMVEEDAVAVAPVAPPAVIVTRNPIEFIRNATAVEMFAILDNEPSSLVAQLLAIENWRWKSSFLQMCSPIRQDRIRAAATFASESAPARTQFLVQAIGDRVKAGGAASASAPGVRSGTNAVARTMNQAILSFHRLVRTWKR